MADEDQDELMMFIKKVYYQEGRYDPPFAKEYKSPDEEGFDLYKHKHAEFASKGLEKLGKGMTGLDSGQPWFFYWISQALENFKTPEFEVTSEQKVAATKYISHCQDKVNGGFGGSPYHICHLASSYAAILGIVNIGTIEAYEMVDRDLMKKVMLSLKNNLKYADHLKKGLNLVDN